MRQDEVQKIDNLICQVEGILTGPEYNGRIEDLRGAWPYVKAHLINATVEAITPWWIKLFWRIVK